MKIFSLLLLLCAACQTQALSSQIQKPKESHFHSIPGEYLNQGRHDGKASNNKPFPRKRLDEMLLAMIAVVETPENSEQLDALRAEKEDLTGKDEDDFKFKTAHKALCAMFEDCMQGFGYKGYGYIKVLEKANWYSEMPGPEGKILKKHYNRLIQSLFGLV
eukprot:TRINITY_DN10782_c0_g1_i5.p1 TRINITY_DN10782_c0_g1~~TRINITY_DN10782_c0_g1_i5.p1  ORF type:complete len:161 (+),score=16.81 TRINITY_DN10782_c0_g1_i5:137-619(+)